MKRIAIVYFFLWSLGVASAQSTNLPAGNPSEDDMPSYSFDDRFSTNWYAAVQAALPAGHPPMGRYDFQASTNGLCQESDRGNKVAQGLWGTALVILSSSPETTEAGLKLLHASAESGYVSAMMTLANCLKAANMSGETTMKHFTGSAVRRN
jgi:hypothetical protein